MLRRTILCCVLASGVVTMPGLVLAKGAPSAKQAEKDGQKAEKQQKWDEAKSAYEQAIELDDKPDTRIHLASVEEKLGHLVEAAKHLNKALESKSLSAAQRVKAKTQLKSLEKRTPTIAFDLPKGFSGKVMLDDHELSVGDLGSPVPANPGKHEVRAESEGMKPYSESIELKEKDKKNLSVLMTEAPQDEAAPADAPAEKDTPKKSAGGSKTLAYVALGVGVVGVGVGAFMGLQAKSTKSDIDAECKNGVCGEAQRDMYDKGKTQANISTVGFIVGAVGIGVGTVLLLTGGKSEVEGKASARRVTPYVGPGQAGVFGHF